MVKQKKQDPSKLWRIVNSAFFLWFLSTIIIGTGTFSFKKWDNERKIFLSNQESIKKLDLEISSRLQYFYEQILAKLPAKTAILFLENPAKSEFPPGVFPQYTNRPLRSLLWELKSLVSITEKFEIQIALNAAKEFKKIYLATKKYPEIKDLVFDIPVDVAVDEELENFFLDLKTDSEVTQFEPKKLQKDDISSNPEVKAKETEKTEDKVEPFHIKFGLNIKFDEASNIIMYTFKSFNLKRWGYPFKNFEAKADIKTVKENKINN